MKVAIYARVSLDDADNRNKRFQNPENQLIARRGFVKSMGYEIVNEYIDKMSGANPARPMFRKMLQESCYDVSKEF